MFISARAAIIQANRLGWVSTVELAINCFRRELSVDWISGVKLPLEMRVRCAVTYPTITDTSLSVGGRDQTLKANL